MDFTFWTILFAAINFAGALICLGLGRSLGKSFIGKNPDRETGMGVIDAAIIGLLGLLLAFTFYGAASRFDTRRQLVVDETNIIGTVYKRIDLLPPEYRPALKEKLRLYVDSRLTIFRELTNPEVLASETKRSLEIQQEFWNESVAAAQASDWTPAGMLLIPSINQMLDISTTRTMVLKLHPPLVVFFLLTALVLASGLIAGFESARATSKSWMHIIVFCLIMTLMAFVIVDLEFPRVGFFRVDAFDEALINLRQSMN